MKIEKVNRNIQIIASYDIVVCGGGPSGIISAIASARNGARVALIERYGFLGGTATAGLVTPISEFNKNGERVIDGIPWEFAERLHKAGGATIDYPIGNVPFDPEIYKLVAQRMVIDAGVDLFLHSYISYCDCIDGSISFVMIENKSGSQGIAGKYFIDCTGDADLAFLAGVPMQERASDISQMQPASLCFRLSGVDTAHLEGIQPREQNKKYFNKRVQDILNSLRATIDIPVFGGPWFCTTLRDGTVNVNMTRMAADATDNRNTTLAECKLREDAFRFAELLKQHIPEFENCYLSASAVQVSFRESRRIKGRHILTGSEYLSAVHFSDSIARGAHPVDIHRANDSNQDVQFLREAGYIPYRCLIAASHHNLLTAGRCISADRESSASIRVQATAMAIGQAAGTAAALCRKDMRSVSDVDISVLRQRLSEQKASI